MNYITIPQLASILNISRSTVFKWVKAGKIKATKSGGTWIVDDPDVLRILEGKLTKRQEEDIKAAVKTATKEYGELFKRLSKE